ncbi:hypothetical protein GBF38_020818 [Nibea albiflora]|uniref:Uncharacterized protein n=1 Tax=Nibea albiflora TaxID=240163 RepID=A0ACB7FIF7_NIBAL|nr:hypothetical protein GBF38_020818 [Nibea albiflora]
MTQLEQERVQWQERRSLVQTNDSLTETIQYKEQEWEDTKEIMNVHLKGLNTYIAQKMRRRKWWERLLH